MTCIIGLVENGKVYIGADSASANNYLIRQTKLEKVFRKDKYIIAYTSSFRMGQLLQFIVNLPEPPKEINLDFMVSKFVETIRECFKNYGYTKIESNQESGGNFLVGIQGRLFHIASDYQVNEYNDGFSADGSGQEYALGAMEALKNLLPPQKRIEKSIEIASKFNPFVQLPAYVIEE